MDFTISITDPAQLAGISWAREQHNATLTPPDPPPPEEGEEAPPPPEPPAGLCETDADYVQWVMEQAAASYAQQQIDAQWRDAYQADMAARAQAAEPAAATSTRRRR